MTQVREVEEVVWNSKHPYSDELIPRNDVVILKLKSEFKMIQNEVQRICLPSMMEEWAPDSKFKCFISGFGLSSIDSSSWNYIKKLWKPFWLGTPTTPPPIPFKEFFKNFIIKHGTLKWTKTSVDLLNTECQDWLEPEFPSNYNSTITDDLICSRVTEDAVTSIR